MPYQNIPRYQSPYGNRYGFRQRVSAPAHAPFNIPVPNAPTSVGTTTQAEERYHSGPSAENLVLDQGQDSGDGGSSEPTGGASYASPAEALAYGSAALDHGYFGTPQDAARQGRTDVLSDFLNNPNVTGERKAPGLIGFAINQSGLAPSHDFTNIDTAQAAVNAQAAQDIGIGVGAFGGLGQPVENTGIGLSSYDPDFGIAAPVDVPENAAQGYTGPASVAQIAQDHGIAEHSVEPGSATHDAISGVGYSPTGAAPAGSQFSSTGVFSSGDDDSGPQGHGGTQSGAQASHSGGYGGFADDAASSDTGGGK